MVTDEIQCLDNDSDSNTFRGDWHYSEVRHQWVGNPVLSPNISDTVASIRHKINGQGNQHMHSGAMKKEYMDRILTWSVSKYPLDAAFHYLRSAMAGSGSPTLDNCMKSSISERVEYLTFSTVAFTVWTRSVSCLQMTQ